MFDADFTLQIMDFEILSSSVKMGFLGHVEWCGMHAACMLPTHYPHIDQMITNVL